MANRGLEAWLTYIEGLHARSIDMGLERCRVVAQRLQLTPPRVVTITGTNGKGSTATLVAALLTALDWRVGLYTSPHLLRYNERVRICGLEADDVQLCEAFAAIEAARGDIPLTYFEMGTLAAFWLFQRAGLDVWVLEVGLGGRLDAVNLLDADVSIITGIGLDHAEWLGTTRDSVAREKIGIARAGCPLLCGDLEPPKVVLDEVLRIGCALYQRGRDYDGQMTGPTEWCWSGRDAAGTALAYEGLPIPRLPLESAAHAVQAVHLLGVDLSRAALEQGLRQAFVPGRLQVQPLRFQGKALGLLLDVGHNPQAAVYLAEHLRPPASGVRHAVFGLLQDKDLPAVLAPLSARVAQWWVAALPTPRTCEPEALVQALLEQDARVTACVDIATALHEACVAAPAGSEVLVYGSFYCVAEALEWLKRDECVEMLNGLND